VLLPVAVEMLYEKVAVHNIFSFFGSVSSTPAIRNGSIRAQGPFEHAILAGTVGAVCLPLVISIWKNYRKTAGMGIVACVLMIITSKSSGPIMSAVVAFIAILMWNYRHYMRLLRRLAIIGYIVLELVMKVPAYYLIGRVDLTGGSTGWHRARLIESAMEHLNEWWFAGTDYTRHWMPTGVSWDPNHTDITNHYLIMGVIGGLPLMTLFILLIITSLGYVGKIIQKVSTKKGFIVWCFGAALFVYAVTSISVSFFDQSFIFLYITLAAISSLCSVKRQGLVKKPITCTNA
jgi:hypothetical protein